MGRTEQIRHMSTADLAALGMPHLAYVKPIESKGEPGFAICAADGTQMAVVTGDRDLAFAVVRQNDLEPVSVH